ncbi:hypothetical protein [Haladaptatus cibarius]|uniref:hypothetical protein n=1 Tax=Haladaptatus cibarius TaxID=453847 RepID=UPI00130DD710|nr:hypothetical protein [Haladaptatus cibarius]
MARWRVFEDNEISPKSRTRAVKPRATVREGVMKRARESVGEGVACGGSSFES